MRNFILILSLVLLAACHERPKRVPRVYTELQVQAINELSKNGQAFMDSCYRSPDAWYTFSDCQKNMNNALNCQQVAPQQGGTSIGTTAVGTALGIGAAKVMLGK